MNRFILGILALLWIGGVATAQQLPGPFGQPPSIPHKGAPGTLPQCTPEYVTAVKGQLAQAKALRGKTGEQILALCDGIKSAEKALTSISKSFGFPEDALTKAIENAVGDLGKPLGIPRIDFRYAKHLCVHGAGESERVIVTEIGRLESELSRCAGI